MIKKLNCINFRIKINITFKVRQRIEEFKDNLPVVQTLGNPDMKERHWEKVSEIVGFPLKADGSLTLARIIDFGLGDYNSKFQVISDSATKENNLEKALNLMVEEWADMEFSVVPYRFVNLNYCLSCKIV
jgi:dynein heavy chain